MQADVTENKVLEAVKQTITESNKYGLTTEVIAWTLLSLCGDPDRVCEELDHNLNEWVK